MRNACAILAVLVLSATGATPALAAGVARGRHGGPMRGGLTREHRGHGRLHRRRHLSRPRHRHPISQRPASVSGPGTPSTTAGAWNSLTPLPPAAPIAQLDSPTGGAGCAVADTGEDQLWTRTGSGWTGGDGTYSVGLPDGRLAWLFGDTFLGQINPTGSRSSSTALVHNSLIIQGGATLSGDYSMAAPSALVRPANGHGFYWPGAGFVEGGALHVFMLRFQLTGPEAWDFAYRDSAVATFALPSLKLLSVVAVAPALSAVEWGSWVLRDGGYTYIYGVEDSGAVKYAHVARVPSGPISGQWQYWNG